MHCSLVYRLHLGLSSKTAVTRRLFLNSNWLSRNICIGRNSVGNRWTTRLQQRFPFWLIGCSEYEFYKFIYLLVSTYVVFLSAVFSVGGLVNRSSVDNTKH